MACYNLTVEFQLNDSLVSLKIVSLIGDSKTWTMGFIMNSYNVGG